MISGFIADAISDRKMHDIMLSIRPFVTEKDFHYISTNMLRVWIEMMNLSEEVKMTIETSRIHELIKSNPVEPEGETIVVRDTLQSRYLPDYSKHLTNPPECQVNITTRYKNMIWYV